MNSVAFGTPYKTEQSIRNAQMVRNIVAQRFPEWAPQCEPYVNVLPIKAWNQRGYRVKKGEHAIKVWTKVPLTKKNAEGKDEIVGEKNAMANVFALPQVEQR